MSVVVNVPDDYVPSMTTDGSYVDKLPIHFKSIKCGCGSKTIFLNKLNLKNHFKTNNHREWLLFMNSEKENHYKELQRCKSLCLSQQKIIQQQQEKIIRNETIILQQQEKINKIEFYNLTSNID